MDEKVIGHYTILEKLGEGGMGVVYKAEDQKLKRMVALKFLPPHLNATEHDKARFIQEAQAAAALNHPNVCSVIDIQEHEGRVFIVMEYVEGQTLRDKRGSIGFKQAVETGTQIAEGLAAAHEKGIVHRDIKPENIMVRKDGIAQIMDFGLAKLKGVSRLTREGSTVGTAGYMSPEQIQGQEVDHRSDIFSLGVLLYEMFTGKLPFKGVHETALAYEIVNVDAAPMASIVPDIDPALDAIVLECLDRDPNERTQSAKQVAIDLKRFKRDSTRERVSRLTSTRPAYQPAQAPQGNIAQPDARPRNLLPWIVAGVSIVALLAVLAIHVLDRPAGNGEITRFLVSAPSKGSFGRQAPAISPDGRQIAFIARDSLGRTTLWVRPLESVEPRSLPGTEEAAFPFWSPDSRFIAYFADGKLRKVEAAGGPPQTVCTAPDGRGGTWSRDGVIVFAPSYATGLQRVSAGGGTPTDVTSLDTLLREDSHRWPSFLPDGRRFLYLRRGATERSGIYLGSIDSQDSTLLVPSRTNGMIASPGYLLFMRERTLMAQRFDDGSGALTGDAFPLVESVGSDIGYNFGFFSVATNGTFVTGGSVGVSNRELVWYDRAGKRLAGVGRAGALFDFALSPDEKRVVFRRVDLQAGNHDLWILDLMRGTESRFTFRPTLDDDPLWSPDGQYVAFDSNPDGVAGVYKKIASGAGTESHLLKLQKGTYPRDWSLDGRYILAEHEVGNGTELWVVPTGKGEKAFPYAQGDGLEIANGRFSPDGKWVAYSSNESGIREVYVQAFPATQGKWQVSTAGGSAPMWRRDGKVLFYVAPNRKLMMVEVNPSGQSFDQGIPEPLFEIDVDRYDAPNRYAVSRDGSRFLINVPAEATATQPLTVTLNATGILQDR
jgi:serine/threonine protein kinase